MFKLKKKKGFTIAELLIVVAIVLVLTFISIPIFAGKKDKANLAVDLANARSAKAAAISEYIFEDSGKEVAYFFDAKNGTIHDVSDGIEGYGQSSYKALQNMKDKSVYHDVFEGEPIDQEGNKNILKISISNDNVIVSWVPVGSDSGTTPDINPSPVPKPTPNPNPDPNPEPIPTEKPLKSIDIMIGVLPYPYSDQGYVRIYKDNNWGPTNKCKNFKCHFVKQIGSYIYFEGTMTLDDIKGFGLNVDENTKLVKKFVNIQNDQEHYFNRVGFEYNPHNGVFEFWYT